MEAFPNAFLGVLMPEVELLAAPRFKARRQLLGKLKAVGLVAAVVVVGNLGGKRTCECYKKDGVKGNFRSRSRTLNAFGVLKNHRQTVRKIIFAQRVEDFQNTAYGDGLPKVPSI